MPLDALLIRYVMRLLNPGLTQSLETALVALFKCTIIIKPLVDELSTV
jgi:hypothetical protein